MQVLWPHLQRADRHATGGIAPAREVARLRPFAGRWRQLTQGGDAHRHHVDTSFRWRHRFLAAAKDRKAGAVTGIVEADETFILKSAKGSRKLVGRAPRKRGGKAKKPGLSTDEHDAILIVRDRHGETTDAMLTDLARTRSARTCCPSSPRMLCS